MQRSFFPLVSVGADHIPEAGHGDLEIPEVEHSAIQLREISSFSSGTSSAGSIRLFEGLTFGSLWCSEWTISVMIAGSLKQLHIGTVKGNRKPKMENTHRKCWGQIFRKRINKEINIKKSAWFVLKQSLCWYCAFVHLYVCVCVFSAHASKSMITTGWFTDALRFWLHYQLKDCETEVTLHSSSCMCMAVWSECLPSSYLRV